MQNKLNPNQIQEAGIDDDGNKVLVYEKIKPTWITPTKLRMPSGKVITTDANEICYEIYNPNKFKLVFKNIHPALEERVNHPVIEVEPEQFAFMPHRYYMAYIEYIGNNSGERFSVLENFGDDMFKGNKKASAPTARKKLF